MQTFLPYADFRASAEVLDDRRLGKQRVETLQVMRALTLPGYGWQHHPVTAMWRGYRPALMAYQEATCRVWLERGHVDTCLEKTLLDLGRVPEDLAAYERGEVPIPPWNDDEALHESHRSKLVQKAPEHYRELFPDAPDDLDYVWPGTPDSPGTSDSTGAPDGPRTPDGPVTPGSAAGVTPPGSTAHRRGA